MKRATPRKRPKARGDFLQKGVTPEILRGRIAELLDWVRLRGEEAKDEGIPLVDCDVYLNDRADEGIGHVLRVLEHIGVDVSEFNDPTNG